MKSKSCSVILTALAAFLVLVATHYTAYANAEAPATEPSTVTLSLASWSSPVLPRATFAGEEEPPMLAQADDLGGKPVDVYGFQRKSPTRAFLQSFVLPGWGQLYAKSSFWKPIMFVGVEAAGLAGYINFHGKGKDIEDEYEAFADAHWDSLQYVEGLYAVFYSHDYPPSIKDDGKGAWLDTTTYIIDYDPITVRSFSHHAWFKEDGSAVEPNEYYENIGKYNQFNFGWDDFIDPDLDSIPFTRISPNRAKYLGMRDDANSELNKANTMLVVTVANHLLSGFWAALDARAYNRAQDQFGQIESKLRLVKSPSNPKKYMPYLTVGYKF